MHAVFFGVKRAFHATLRITRKALKSFGLTAARFDLMWALFKATGPGYTLQSELRRLLGVTAPTVSRMLKSLKALGFVHVERSCDDRRKCRVSLTELGLRRIEAAAELFVGRRVAKRILERVLGRHPVRGMSRAKGIVKRMCDFEELLQWTRDTCGDTARLQYLWPPDDW